MSQWKQARFLNMLQEPMSWKAEYVSEHATLVDGNRLGSE